MFAYCIAFYLLTSLGLDKYIRTHAMIEFARISRFPDVPIK